MAFSNILKVSDPSLNPVLCFALSFLYQLKSHSLLSPFSLSCITSWEFLIFFSFCTSRSQCLCLDYVQDKKDQKACFTPVNKDNLVDLRHTRAEQWVRINSGCLHVAQKHPRSPPLLPAHRRGNKMAPLSPERRGQDASPVSIQCSTVLEKVRYLEDEKLSFHF